MDSVQNQCWVQSNTLTNTRASTWKRFWTLEFYLYSGLYTNRDHIAHISKYVSYCKLDKPKHQSLLLERTKKNPSPVLQTQPRPVAETQWHSVAADSYNVTVQKEKPKTFLNQTWLYKERPDNWNAHDFQQLPHDTLYCTHTHKKPFFTVQQTVNTELTWLSFPQVWFSYFWALL